MYVESVRGLELVEHFFAQYPTERRGDQNMVWGSGVISVHRKRSRELSLIRNGN